MTWLPLRVAAACARLRRMRISWPPTPLFKINRFELWTGCLSYISVQADCGHHHISNTHPAIYDSTIQTGHAESSDQHKARYIPVIFNRFHDMCCFNLRWPTGLPAFFCIGRIHCHRCVAILAHFAAETEPHELWLKLFIETAGNPFTYGILVSPSHATISGIYEYIDIDI